MKMRNKKKEKGFTLVELLAVILVFSVVSAIAAAILVSSLRTATKTNVINLVKQNGDFAVSQLAKSIRDARSLRFPFPCVQVVPTPFPIPISSLTITDTYGNQIVYSCNGPLDNPPNTIASQGASFTPDSLLDTTAVSLSSCTFTCAKQSASDYPVIGIQFSLVQKSTSSLAEQIASKTPVLFNTSILMRNLNR
jgi:prepilin-type N-terminal cleavage/methylation domain-containing protein